MVPSRFEELRAKVRLYLEVNRFDAAEKLVRQAIEDDGDLANLHHLLGLVFHKQSRFLEALQCFRNAVRVNPAYIEASLNLAITLCDLSQYEDAFRIFEELKQQNDFHLQIPRLVLGRIASLHTQAGHAYSEVGMMPEAIQEYRKAITIFPQLIEARLALARLYMRSQEPHKAKKELDDILKLQPMEPEAHVLLGLVHEALGERSLAKDSWTRARQSEPDHPAAKILLDLAKTSQISKSP